MKQSKKLKIDRAVIVEGKYDKIKLESLIDGLILTTDGFRIFKDREKRELICALAKTRGILVITDSDVAGFKIRDYIKSIAKDGKVSHLYIPQIAGKEHRKTAPSKEGTLGVEGMDADFLRELMQKQGVLCSDVQTKQDITKATFLEDGLIGASNSAQKRKLLLAHLNLPSYMNTNALLKVINILMTYEEYCLWLDKISL